MSTRSIIVVTGLDRNGNAATTRLYKHSDGYPTGTLPAINTAIARAKQLVDEANSKYPPTSYRPAKEVSMAMVTGCLIGATTDVYGMGAYIEKDYDSAFDKKHLGNQADLEWIYLIDTDAKTVGIYGGGYTGDTPQNMFAAGTVDPMSYVECVREEYKEEERKEIAELIERINKTGFTIMPSKPAVKKTRKSKKVAV